MNKIKKIWNDHKKEILIGIIVSIVTTVLWNIITWFVRESPKMGTTLFETLRNIFYRLAAMQTESSISEIILSSFFGMTLGIIFGIVFSVRNKVKKTIDKTKSIVNENDEKVDDNQDNTLTEKELLRRIKKTTGSLTVLVVVFACVLVLAISSVIIPADIYKKFNRDITMISPYVDNHEIVQLKSKWVLMKEYDDYKKIYYTIDEIKEINNLSK